MATNYAEKYAKAIDERFSLSSLTENAFNNGYDWEGVQAVNVYSVGTAPMRDYSMTGSERYGTADELGTTAQTMIPTQDRSFTFTIDRRNYSDQMMVTEAGAALARQIDEVVVPEVDIYRLSKLVLGAGTVSAPTPIDSGYSAYEAFLDGVSVLLDNKAPLAGSFAFISPSFFKQIRLDNGFIKESDAGQAMLVNGQVGKIENIPLILAPTSYFPAGVEFILTNKMAAVAPIKLAQYKTHNNPPGINGWLCEGRVYYDAFVLDSKAKAVYVHKSSV